MCNLKIPSHEHRRNPREIKVALAVSFPLTSSNQYQDEDNWFGGRSVTRNAASLEIGEQTVSLRIDSPFLQLIATFLNAKGWGVPKSLLRPMAVG